MPQNGMRAVTIGADGGLPDPQRHCLAMNAGLELIRDIAVADAALVRKRLAEGLGLRPQQLMGTAVAEGAIGSGAVPFSLFLAVNTLPELRGLILMAGNTLRLWEIGRVWKDLVVFMTRVASQGAMRTL